MKKNDLLIAKTHVSDITTLERLSTPQPNELVCFAGIHVLIYHCCLREMLLTTHIIVVRTIL